MSIQTESAREHINGRGATIIDPFGQRDSGAPGDRFSFIYPHQIELKPRRWLVPSLIPLRGFGVFFGPSGCGKSFWIVHLALCIALGLDFLGKPAKRAGVIIVAAEDAEGLKFRLVAALKALGVEINPDQPLPIAIIPEAPDLASEDGDADALIDAIQSEADVLREYGATLGLVLVDTYRDAMPGLEENDSRATSAAVRTLRRIGAETNALVLVVAHTSKAGDGEDPRGSSALIGAADVALGVRFEDQKVEGEIAPIGPPERVLWIRKQRNGPDAKGDQTLRWSYALERVELDLMGEDGEPEASCVVRVLGAPQASAPKLKRLSDKARLVEKAIVAILSDNRGKRAPAHVPCPADRHAVRIENLREEARRLGISDAASKDPAEAVRKAVARGKEELIAHNKIFEDDGWIWQAKQ